MDIKSAIKELTREELELKFINMFSDYSMLKKSEEETALVDFTDFKVRRRQQYLHKTYTINAPVLNGILKLFVDTNDKNIHLYLSKLNSELEAKATQNNDLPK